MEVNETPGFADLLSKHTLLKFKKVEKIFLYEKSFKNIINLLLLKIKRVIFSQN